MRSVKLVAMVALLATGMVYGQSTITWTLETGGNNNSAAWELGTTPMPYFVSGVTGNTTTVAAGQDLTWAVRVAVSGTHTGTVGTAGVGKTTKGAANLVFDLELYGPDGLAVPNCGAAPLVCTSGTPGAAGALNCHPSGKGFWSTINDGDTDNQLPSEVDVLANGSFAVSLYYTSTVYPPAAGTQLYRLIDPLPGPNFDYGWYPTSNGRGGIDTAGTKTINTGVTTVNSKLVGFGAGYKAYNNTSYRAGVGLASLGIGVNGYGSGRPLFEGQLNTTGLAAGTYRLKIVPSVDGSNVIHGDVVWNSLTPNYGGFGSFAVKANVPNALAQADGVTFTVGAAPYGTVAGRHIFYNQSVFDGNKAAIDAAAVVGTFNDDQEAVDGNKIALRAGIGMGYATQAQYTGFSKGITGVIVDIASAPRAPVVGDFAFINKGRTGTGTAVVTPSDFKVWVGAGDGGSDRCFIAFTADSLKLVWLEVQVLGGTGKLLATQDTHWWGNSPGDCVIDGHTTAAILTNASDAGAVKAGYNSLKNPSPVTSLFDIDKSRVVDAQDVGVTKAFYNSTKTCLVPLNKP